MSQALNKESEQYLYQQVIEMIKKMQDSGTLRIGDKLPSLRKLSQQLNVSIPTVKLAYLELERQDLIVARPKSGYFMKSQPNLLAVPRRSRLTKDPIKVDRQHFIEHIFNAVDNPNMVPLGISAPTAAYSAEKALARIMRQVLSKAGAKAVSYAPMDGYPPLKRQLAMRYFDYGLQVDQSEIIITNGAQEAIAIALKCVAKPGDVIAIESPCYFGIIELVESLGMLAVEIPLCPNDGIWYQDLEKSIKKHNIKACVFSTSVNNPLGSYMTEAKKKQVVELLEKHNIPMIEDDVYGDLYFTEKRGMPAQKYAKKGLVLSCSSFSKTAAPGYRIGWLIAGKYAKKAKVIKRALSCSSSLINQWTLAEYIAGHQYDRYLIKLREILKCNKDRMLAKIQCVFPKETQVTNPQGGAVLWLKLPNNKDAKELFYEALEQNISIIPGDVFSPSNRYKHFIRLSYGIPWDTNIEMALENLSKMCNS
ncbi:MAG: PLP-dependent aminotransferase family protein [Marinicellaceae bacterium]